MSARQLVFPPFFLHFSFKFLALIINQTYSPIKNHLCNRISSQPKQSNIAVLKVVQEKVSSNLPSSTWRPHWTLRAEQQRSSKPSDWLPLVYNISHTLVVLATRNNELHISIPSSCIITNIFILIILLSHMSVTHFKKTLHLWGESVKTKRSENVTTTKQSIAEHK